MKNLIKKILGESDFEWAEDLISKPLYPKRILVDGKRYAMPNKVGYENWRRINGWKDWYPIIGFGEHLGEECFIVDLKKMYTVYIPISEYTEKELNVANERFLTESDFEWAEDLINDDSFYSRVMSLIPDYRHQKTNYLITYSKPLNEEESKSLLQVIKRKGWPTSTAKDDSRINLIYNYSRKNNGYIVLKLPYITFGYSIETYESVNDVKWNLTPKIII